MAGVLQEVCRLPWRVPAGRCGKQLPPKGDGLPHAGHISRPPPSEHGWHVACIDLCKDFAEKRMALDIYKNFDLNARALSVANQRLELLADNVANADTPGYKARDIDFRTAMQSAGNGGELGLKATSSRHLMMSGVTGPNSATPMYRVPDQPSLDGNTVDSQRENAAIAETSVRYQASLTFLSAQIRSLRDAINGGR
jgi:flagellar basal-body rod protein FlgB